MLHLLHLQPNPRLMSRFIALLGPVSTRDPSSYFPQPDRFHALEPTVVIQCVVPFYQGSITSRQPDGHQSSLVPFVGLSAGRYPSVGKNAPNQTRHPGAPTSPPVSEHMSLCIASRNPFTPLYQRSPTPAYPLGPP